MIRQIKHVYQVVVKKRYQFSMIKRKLLNAWIRIRQIFPIKWKSTAQSMKPKEAKTYFIAYLTLFLMKKMWQLITMKAQTTGLKYLKG